jgi:hypothetical protein
VSRPTGFVRPDAKHRVPCPIPSTKGSRKSSVPPGVHQVFKSSGSCRLSRSACPTLGRLTGRSNRRKLVLIRRWAPVASGSHPLVCSRFSSKPASMASPPTLPRLVVRCRTHGADQRSLPRSSLPLVFLRLSARSGFAGPDAGFCRWRHPHAARSWWEGRPLQSVLWLGSNPFTG